MAMNDNIHPDMQWGGITVTGYTTSAPHTPWTREEYLNEFHALTDKMREITAKKNNDYGGVVDPFKNFRTFGELGILVRMSDKFARLRTAIEEKREFAVAEESVEDSALDLANYALLFICYRRGV